MSFFAFCAYQAIQQKGTDLPVPFEKMMRPLQKGGNAGPI
jgi:hypothetical protein